MKKIISLLLILTMLFCIGCGNNKEKEALKYTIANTNYYDNAKLAERGYFIEELKSNDIYLTICMGEHSTGGYDITVNGMQYDETSDTLTITVQEKYPDPNLSVTQAFTYPYCIVSLNRVPNNIKVIDTFGFEFNKIKGV